MTDELRPITEVEIQAMRDAFERLRSHLSPEHHALLMEEIEFFAELRAMVSEHDGDGEVLVETLFEEARRRARARVSR